jgi:hypothetical protein
MSVILENLRIMLQDSEALDVDLTCCVDENIVDVGILEEWL